MVIKRRELSIQLKVTSSFARISICLARGGIGQAESSRLSSKDELAHE